MPRLGSGQYYLPPGTTAAPDTTVESARYNIFTADIETEINQIHTDTAGVNDPVTGLPSKVSKVGDTMTGPLVLPAAAPTLATHAANKSYVDTTATAAASGKVSKAGGDTISGTLTINGVLTVNANTNVVGDLNSTRGTGTTGVVYLGNNAGTRYLYYDGTRYILNGAAVQIGSPAVGTDAARVDWTDANYLPRAGGTITGALTVNGALVHQAQSTFNAGWIANNAAGKIYGDGSNVMIQGAGGGNDAMMTFHRPGAFACNFGLSDDNNSFKYGGWSFGVAWWRFWTERECGFPVSDGRLVLVGDSGLGTAPNGGDYIVELWPGAVMTAWKMTSFYNGGGYTNAINGFRIRYMQLKTSGWYTIGYYG
jgi:hypothetical protein